MNKKNKQVAIIVNFIKKDKFTLILVQNKKNKIIIDILIILQITIEWILRDK